MKKIYFLLAVLSLTNLHANQQPTSKRNPAYGNSTVLALLKLNVKEDVDTVHFVRDNNDPKIITKTYIMKHADPYSIRPYLREIVQALRVDYNNDAGREDPAYYNRYHKKGILGNIYYVPTGIECLKFADGTGVIIISAEDYRFKSNEFGMGIDDIVKRLDIPGILNSSGQPKFIYFPKYRKASDLRTMVKLVGANVSNDTVELIGGKDKVEVDEDLNCMFLNTALYSRKNIEDVLKLYDVPHPEVRVSIDVYEIQMENDGTLGLDFQSWKNNDGFKLFAVGSRWSKNYNLSDLIDIVQPDGTINSSYFNFQPKWNSKFVDLLVSKSKASIVTSGEITVQNGSTGTLEHRTGTLYAKLTSIPPTPNPQNADEKIQHGNAVDIKVDNDKFNFNLEITPSITRTKTTMDIKIKSTSLIGYDSTGAIRTSDYQTSQKVMISNKKNRFYLGGIKKTQLVSDVGGVPFLKDLPGIGWVFATERESTKHSQLVVIAKCRIIYPDSDIEQKDLHEIEIIKKKTKVSTWNSFGYRQWFLDPDRRPAWLFEPKSKKGKSIAKTTKIDKKKIVDDEEKKHLKAKERRFLKAIDKGKEASYKKSGGKVVEKLREGVTTKTEEEQDLDKKEKRILEKVEKKAVKETKNNEE